MLYEEHELAHALGLSGGSLAVSGVSIDSRTLEKGDVFFALKGERVDGSLYVEQAFQRGAACAVVAGSRSSSADATRKNDGHGQGHKQGHGQGQVQGHVLEVEDTTRALVRCGCYARGRTSARIIAITGSLGKTSLRAMLQEVLQELTTGKVCASQGNLNNHIGVPLSLARMARDCDYGIFELGMNHAGEIAALGSWVRAHVGVITSIAAVHSEFFNDETEICDAKGELLEWVSEAALLPATEPYASRLRDKAVAAGIERVAFFGREETSDYVLQRWSDPREASDDSVSVRATFPQRATPSSPPSPSSSSSASSCNADKVQKQKQERRELRWQAGGRGYARALASLCALATCDLLGLVPDKISAGLWDRLARQQPPRGRGRLARLSLSGPPRNIRLIDESYNASPQAVENALAVLARFPPRRLAALGDMLELGGEGARLHADLALCAARCCDLVFTCGSLSEKLYKALPRDKRGAHDVDADAMATRLYACLKDGDTLLVKGSLGSRLARAVSYLEERAVGHGY